MDLPPELDALRRLGVPLPVAPSFPGEDPLEALVRRGLLAPHQAQAARAYLSVHGASCACGQRWLPPPGGASTSCPGCGRAPAASVAPPAVALQALTAGSRLGSYVVLGRLGRGTSGEVFRVRHEGLQRDAALKLVYGAAADPRRRRRFAREVEALGRLDHPSIVRTQAAFEVGDALAFVMDLAEGETLAARVARAGPLAWREAAALVAGLARGVAHAHTRDVVHRDLKPENVVLREQGVPVIVDFGLSCLRDAASSLTAAGVLVGSPTYMSPEAFRGEGDARSDIYGLGVILYEALSGRPPFAASSLQEQQVLVSQGRCAPTEAPGAPPALEAVRARAMHVDPTARYARAEDLADDLERLLRADRGGVASAPGGRAPCAAAVVVVIALVVLLLVAWRSGQAPPGPVAAAPTADVARDPLARARALGAGGRWREAAEAAGHAADGPARARALLLGGVARIRGGDLGGARADLLAAAAVATGGPEERTAARIAQVCARVLDDGPLPLAREDLRALTDAAPAEVLPDGLAALAWVNRLDVMDDPVEVLEGLLLAEDGRPLAERPDRVADRAVVFARAGLLADAREAVEALRDRWPTSPDVHAAAAWLHACTGDGAAAEASLAAARAAGAVSEREARAVDDVLAESAGPPAARARALGSLREGTTELVLAPGEVVLHGALDLAAGAAARVSVRGAEVDVDLHVHAGELTRPVRDGDYNAATPSPDEDVTLAAGPDTPKRYRVVLFRPEPCPDLDVLVLRIEPAEPSHRAAPWIGLQRQVQLATPEAFVLATRARARGDVTRALALLDPLLAGDPEAHRLRARWLVDAGRWAEAREALARLPTGSEVQHLAATCAWELNAREEAVATWSSLVDREPLALEPRLALVEAHLASGRLDEARADVEELLGADPGLDVGPVLLAATSGDLERLDTALQAPGLSPAALRLGAAELLRREAPGRALALLEAARARLGALSPRLELLRARSLAALGLGSEARRALVRLRARAVTPGARARVLAALGGDR